jgi:hypothetical protein
MVLYDRQTPLPAEMQGSWVDSGDPSSRLIIDGAEIICLGASVDYDFKEISEVEDALSVQLHVSDPSREDDFQRANITGLVISPEGEFLAYNTRFSMHLIKAP